MKVINSIYVLILFLCTTVFAQKAELITGVNYVELDFSFSKRIPYNHVNIQLRKKYYPKQIIEAHIISKPLYDDEKWEYSKIDTVYVISQKDYSQIVKTIDDIEIDSLKNYFNSIILGVQSTLTFGTSNSITYRLGNPTRKKEPSYYDTCVKILEVTGIDPKLFLKDYQK